MMALVRTSPVCKLTTDVAAARDRFNNAERDLSSLKREITNIETTLGKFTADQWYGPQGEFKKLDGTCIETIAGE